MIVRHVALDDFCVRSRQSGRAACVTNKFSGSFYHPMAFSSLSRHNLSRCGYFEPLFGTGFSLHFGHFDLLFQNVNALLGMPHSAGPAVDGGFYAGLLARASPFSQPNFCKSIKINFGQVLNISILSTVWL